MQALAERVGRCRSTNRSSSISPSARRTTTSANPKRLSSPRRRQCGAPRAVALRRDGDHGLSRRDCGCFHRRCSSPPCRRGGIPDEAGVHRRHAAFGHDPCRTDSLKPPEVYGAGERSDFENETVRLVEMRAKGSKSAALSEIVANGLLRALGGAYLKRLEANAPEARKITDKMPANFRFIGLIRLALPNARVIHMRRDPADTCLSCFGRLFAAICPGPTTLARSAATFAHTSGSWRTGTQPLPGGVMLEMRYEDLVADLEGQTRRMLDHCGLEWDANCLDFHRTERAVRTASAPQVRKPIYRSSVKRWRAYERWLGPLLAELQPSMEAYERGCSVGPNPFPRPSRHHRRHCLWPALSHKPRGGGRRRGCPGDRPSPGRKRWRRFVASTPTRLLTATRPTSLPGFSPGPRAAKGSRPRKRAPGGALGTGPFGTFT